MNADFPSSIFFYFCDNRQCATKYTAKAGIQFNGNDIHIITNSLFTELYGYTPSYNPLTAGSEYSRFYVFSLPHNVAQFKHVKYEM